MSLEMLDFLSVTLYNNNVEGNRNEKRKQAVA
jgi:hypothetical protein